MLAFEPYNNPDDYIFAICMFIQHSLCFFHLLLIYQSTYRIVHK